MASPVVEPQPALWLSYFFLYDGSKVKEEGDPTRAGINYFYPPQTCIDQQELLCGQIAGVVRCITEISKSPPNLIRLRKLKFAIQVHGEYLWALGCSMDIADVSCKCFLEDLVGLFRFYNGPLWHAYRVRSREELSEEWNLYLEYIQNTPELHRIFNSLSHVDKTKVDPLLLLKAALILQTCQRFPHILAGCIMYNNRIVSTQLPPALTSRILLQRLVLASPTASGSQDHDTCLPQDVNMIPVFLMEKEATALRQYPVQWMTRIPSFSRRTSSMSHSLSEEAQINRSHISEADFLDEEKMQESSSLTKVDLLEQSSVEIVTSEQESVISDTACVSTMVPTVIQSSSPVQQILHPGDKAKQEFIKVGDHDNVFTDTNPENIYPVAFDDQPEDVSKRDYERRSDCLSTGSYATCYSTDELEKSSPESGFSNPEDSKDTIKTQVLEGQEEPPTKKNSFLEDPQEHLLNTVVSATELLGITEGDTQVTAKGSAEVITQLYERSSKEDILSNRTSSITDWTLTLDSNPSISSSKLVKMVLYVHNVNGLVLSLIAENDFKYIREFIQDVYDSTLASLNGLEVHLKETLPHDNNNVAKSTHNFTHYDLIQNILTANLPSSSNTQDRHFLRAANLIHADFSAHPSLLEVTIRNGSSAVFGCQSSVHETYFQQLSPPFRNSGGPDSQDTAFMLQSKAKQKLLKYGLNLL
ncbi:PREDICTED: Hermansky-Pudlak syndrome 4 protein [Nanorana parkeri]|uniref:Hermansky-Pudlak syndrome 4 protein n=1 Tax=Nanorana parkeri TaxID=125878 RepID=UPI0008550270|nr:PREDICTED: Hermansky-Pudlak syndrome 4 protein [Nanorana parkeri]XP_018420135.1 PREDICTED: Hermansky-Pudlak syndrome 4 protein [Nanorana parkeri]